MFSSDSEGEEIDNAVERLLDLQYRVPRPRIYLARSNAFEDLNDEKFFLRFRLSKHTVGQILAQIGGQLERQTNRNKPISPMNQLLLTLRFYATGAFLIVCGDLLGVHKSMASRIVKKVTYQLALMSNQLIKMPSDRNEREVAMKGFYLVAGYLGVIGCIDCTHIPIQSPGGENAELFRNRKQYFSINVQAICDSDLLFSNIVARWPGYTHDSTIFIQSGVHAQMENRVIPEGVLLGDNGYACRRYLHTPLLTPTTRAEHNYNAAQKTTRNIIERAFGVLKRRFPCLSMKMRVKLDTVLQIIVATSVLHNIAVVAKEAEAPVDPDVHLDPEVYAVVPVAAANELHQGGATAARAALINTVFNR